MIIKIKGTDKQKTVNPNEWATIERIGNANNFEIVERNTIWAEQLNDKLEPNGIKRELEKDHWDKMLLMGSKLRWRIIDKPSSNKSIKEEYTLVNSTKEVKNTIADLQYELIESQIKESKANTELSRRQTKDLKYKYVYFIIGIILGNLGTVLLWIQWLSREIPSPIIP